MSALRKFILALVILLALGTGGWLLTRALSSSAENESAIPTTTVEERSIVQSILSVGRVAAIRATPIKSEVSGQIAAVHCGTGDIVQAGDILVELDRGELSSQIQEANHRITASQLKVEKAQLELEAQRELQENSFSPQRAFRDAEIDFALAQNELAIEKAKLQTLNEKLAKTTIRAPHGGTILQSSAREGTVIAGATSFSQGTLLMEVADLGSLKVECDVNEVDIGQLHLGMPVGITFDAFPDIEATGEIVFLSPSASAAVEGEANALRQFPVTVALQKTDPTIRPGMSAIAKFEIARKENVLALSLPAIFQEGKKSLVYRSEADRFQSIEITTGINDLHYIEVVSGLEKGDRVALSRPPEAPENPS